MSAAFGINDQRLLERLDCFAAIGATAKGGVNRQALTDLDRQSRALLAEFGQARGFTVFQDPMANLFIRRAGRQEELPPLLIGSHLDSQPAGGRFDGALGTLTAFEVLETLEDRGVETERSVEVVAWTNEEGCRFAPGCMGSAAFAAGNIPESWSGSTATDGARFDDELKATIESLPQARMRPLGFPIFAYLELHIEQGPSLEKEGIPLGIVTSIQGTRWLEVTITGQTAHAGTTALEYRRDPMQVMASSPDLLYRTIMPGDRQVRFTVGRMRLEPGSVNAIPQSAWCTIDIRHPESEAVDRIAGTIAETFTGQARERACHAEIRRIFDMPPAKFPDAMLDALDKAAAREGLATKTMLSGAFHDALFINRVAPSAMIFVPCRDGLSHNEDENVEPEHAIAGCRMLLSSALEVLKSQAHRVE